MGGLDTLVTMCLVSRLEVDIIMQFMPTGRGATDQKTHRSDLFSDQSHGLDHFSGGKDKTNKLKFFVFSFCNTFKLL